MIYSITEILALIVAASFAMQFVSRLRTLRGAEMDVKSSNVNANLAGRYRPMLRLLSDEDMAFAAIDPKVARSLKAERRRIFRGYLRCLTKDYGRLLAGIRMVMVQSHVDRPDLAYALGKNRMLFALAICRIEFHLSLHTLGLGKVDISGVVEAFDRLREHAVTLSAVPTAA
jgi:hypothetical protein